MSNTAVKSFLNERLINYIHFKAKKSISNNKMAPLDQIFSDVSNTNFQGGPKTFAMLRRSMIEDI